jgi:Zn-dependent protease with chaperone function
MFKNFIYFIVALLVYSTHQPTETPNFNGIEAALLALLLYAGYIFVCRYMFVRLERKVSRSTPARSDHAFNLVLNQVAIIALTVFCIDIYGLQLNTYWMAATPFRLIPTLQALLFLGLFILFLASAWAQAHGIHQRLYGDSTTRRQYILSNIAFSLPVVLPWLIMSGVADVLFALPFEQPKGFLSTTQGQVLYFLVFLLIIAAIGPAMIQKFWRCRPVGDGWARRRIQQLCRVAGVRYADILYWPLFGGRMITAGVMGLLARFRYILVTEALLRFLDPQEIDAVMAHEIGHVKRHHLQFYLIFFAGYTLFSFAVYDLLLYLLIYTESAYGLAGRLGVNQMTAISAALSLCIIVIFLLYFRYIFGYFMRNFERQADGFVYTLFQTAAPLVSTFEKIVMASGQSPDKPNWHHFSIRERIDYLLKCEADRSWIQRHDRKIRRSMAVYLAALALVGGIGYKLNFGTSGERLDRLFLTKIIQQELTRSSKNPNLLNLLGDLHYGAQHYSQAIAAYEDSLELIPHNTNALNNLAWLYATCDNHDFRNPPRALALAKQAANLEPAPHILDTLAESYFVNGQMAAARDVAQQALALARKNRDYYTGQLQKFSRSFEN